MSYALKPTLQAPERKRILFLGGQPYSELFSLDAEIVTENDFAFTDDIFKVIAKETQGNFSLIVLVDNMRSSLKKAQSITLAARGKTLIVSHYGFIDRIRTEYRQLGYRSFSLRKDVEEKIKLILEKKVSL